jgi:uncharacterized protein involved in type VI secretion and phage assembly
MSLLDTLGRTAANEDSRESDGFLQGLAVGVVTDNQDPEGLARVRVRLPWHSDSDTSYWARIATPMGGPEQGAYFLPEIDDEVLVGAEFGDPTHLYVLGALWSGRLKPPETNADGRNDRRLVRSRAGHQLTFNDGDDKPEVELKLADGKRLLIERQGVTLEDEVGNRLRIESNSGEVSVKAALSLKLEAQSISLQAGASLELKSSGVVKINGAIVQIN